MKVVWVPPEYGDAVACVYADGTLSLWEEIVEGMGCIFRVRITKFVHGSFVFYGCLFTAYSLNEHICWVQKQQVIYFDFRPSHCF